MDNPDSSEECEGDYGETLMTIKRQKKKQVMDEIGNFLKEKVQEGG